MRKPTGAALAAVLVLTAVTGCFGGGDDDCEAQAAAVMVAPERPGPRPPGGGAKGKAGSKPKTGNGGAPVRHVDADDCDDD